MSRQANKALIGGFVVGAIILSIAAIMFFGSGTLFSQEKTFVLFFDGSIRGLDIGAPVMFRGVKIGSVSDIKVKVKAQDDDWDVWIPVYVKIEPKRFNLTEVNEDKKSVLFGRGSETSIPHLEQMIQRGLRAQLRFQSVVTGKLFIALDFFPDKPAVLVGREKNIPEIPTVPTSFQEAANTAQKIIEEIRELPVQQFLENANQLLQHLDSLVQSQELEDTITSLNQALKEIARLASDVDEQVKPLAATVQDTAANLRSALIQSEKTLVTLQERIAEDSPLRQELLNTLNSLAEAARSLQILTDYLEQHPEALIRGKGQVGE